MKFDPTLVVNSPSPGSMLGRIVAEEYRLGLRELFRWVVLDSAIGSIKAELDALRAAHSTVREHKTCSTITRNILQDIASQESGFAHVAGIHLSNSAITRVLTITRLNFCPRCWLARVRQSPISKEHACKDCIGLAKLDDAEETKVAKRGKTLEKCCADFKRKNNAKLTAKGWVGYSPEEFDRDILESRGGVMGDAVRQFEKQHSRRLKKYRVR